MSRLNPFFDPAQFGGVNFLAGNPFLRPPQPSVSDLLPRIDPAEERSILGQAMESGLGGLAYVGKLLDKPARAVRGAIGGGDPSELLSFLPFSDSLGVTDEKNTVSGRDLLTRSNILGPDDDPNSFGWGDAAGVAAEIALDPTTYLGLGPLTRGAGVIAKQAGGLPSHLGDRLAGYAARESDLLPIAQKLGPAVNPADVLRQKGLPGPVMSQAVEDAAAKAAPRLTYTDPLTGLPMSVAGPSPVQPRSVLDPLSGNLVPNPSGPATPLAGLLGIGAPFRQPSAILGVGESGRQTLDALNAAGRTLAYPVRQADAGVQALTGISPLGVVGRSGAAVGRVAGALFDPGVQGAVTAEGQQIGRFKTGLERASDRETLGTFADRNTDLNRIIDPSFGPVPDPALVRRAAVAAAETPIDLIAGRMGVIGAGGRYVLRSSLNPSSPTFLDDLARYAAEAGAPGLPPSVYDEVADIASKTKKTMTGGLNQNQALGIQQGELGSGNVDYLTRAKTKPTEELDPGHGVLELMTPEARRLGVGNASMKARDTAFDLPGGTNQVNDLVKDPRFVGPNRLPDQNVKAEIRTILTGSADPPASSLAWDQAEELNKILKQMPEGYSSQGVDFFSQDIPALGLLRGRRAKASSNAALSAYEGVARFARPAADIEAEGRVPYKVTKLLQKMGLNRVDDAGTPIAPEAAAAKMGISPQALDGLAIPADVANDIFRMNEAWHQPSVLKPVVDAIDYAQNLFKTGVTTVFPSFHVRNVVSGLFNMWRGGVYGSDPRVLYDIGTRAQDFLKGRGFNSKLGIDTDQFWKELVQADILNRSSGANADVLGNAGEVVQANIRRPLDNGRSTVRDLAEAVAGGLNPRGALNAKKAFTDLENYAPVKAGRAVGQTAEDWIRTTHYLGLREKGFSPAAAALEVKKYQLDYRDLSKFEKGVMKRLFPWYSFSRRNLPPLLEDLVTQPAKITAPLRAVTGGRTQGEFVPGYIAEGASVPLGSDGQGSQRYISSFGLPFEDEAVKALGSLAQGDFRRAGEAALGMSRPEIKSPLEYIFDKSLYSGRPLEDLKPYEYATLGGLLDEQQGRKLTQVVANTPLSRTASTVNRLLDDRKDPLTQIVNLVTGVKVSDVDAEKARDAAAKKYLGSVLSGQPGVRHSEDVYVPRDNLPQLSPDEALMYRLYLSADERLRQQAKKRREEAR